MRGPCYLCFENHVRRGTTRHATSMLSDLTNVYTDSTTRSVFITELNVNCTLVHLRGINGTSGNHRYGSVGNIWLRRLHFYTFHINSIYRDSSACEPVGVRYESSEHLPINWRAKADQANRTICFVACTIIEPDVTRSVKKNGLMGNVGISTRYDNNSIIDVTITSRWQQRDEGAQGMSSPLQVKFSKVPITRWWGN